MKPKLTGIAQDKMRENWLARQGSDVEKQMIESLLNYETLTQHEKTMLLEYRNSGDSSVMHRTGFWLTVKKLKLGPETCELALLRHKKLEGNTWFVAYCITNSEGKTLKEIGEKLGISANGVKFHKQKISQIISEGYGHEREGMATDVQIARWFLGQ